MENEKIVLSGAPVEIAEFEDHKLATFLISVLDEYDLNGRMIPKESGELYHSSIVGFPILAKMVCNEAGEPVDFAGHEMYIVTDEEGNSQVRFNTHPIGSVVESWIEERPVAGYIGNKSCIMIKAKLWSTRYPEYFAVLDKLWATHNVKSSWELTVHEAVQTARGRILKAFSFIGNTLLGSNVLGAVPGAGVYEYAQADGELELACALSKDVCIEEAQRKEEGNLENENVTPETVAENEVQEHELQEHELQEQVSETHEETQEQETQEQSEEIQEPVEENEPEEAEVHEEAQEGEPVEGIDVDSFEQTIQELRSQLAARDDAIAKANEKINELSAQIAALQPYKDAADQAEQERIEAEMAQKRAQFKEKMVVSKLFTEDELETSEELRGMIERLDEAALKNEIAERFMAKLGEEPTAEPEIAQVETAAKAANEVSRTQLGEGDTDSKAFMRIFLGRD